MFGARDIIRSGGPAESADTGDNRLKNKIRSVNNNLTFFILKFYLFNLKIA